MALPKWSPTTGWNTEILKYLQEFKVEPILKQTVDNIVANTEKFPIKFPTETNQCKFLRTKLNDTVLEQNINSVYPLLHESALKLCADFIAYKKVYGTPIEQKYYKNFTLKDLINKFLKNRAVAFLCAYDKYKLINGKHGVGHWEDIGTEEEGVNSPLMINECMSYDEIKLSAFLSVSSFTYFINTGSRRNMGKYEDERSIVENNGVIIGLIGARLEKPKVMEYQEVMINKVQNTEEYGFGTNVKQSIPKLFADFYDEKCLNYDEGKAAKRNDTVGRYVAIRDEFFDNYFYYKRLTISIETLLLEANSRAKHTGQSAYVHVVGLGLGVWKISDHQSKVYMDSFAERLKIIGEKLQNVSDICFAYIHEKSCGGYKDGEIFSIRSHPNGGIKIHIRNRDPHEKLMGDDEGKLLVASYAWDANALPGNEYWNGSLAGSGDPAAACSTQIPEIHNPHINPLVSADNLHVATKDGVFSVQEYRQIVENSMKLKV